MTPSTAKQLTLKILSEEHVKLTILRSMVAVALEPYVFQTVTPITMDKMARSVSLMLNSLAPEGTQVAEEPDYLTAEPAADNPNCISFNPKPDAPEWVLKAINSFRL